MDVPLKWRRSDIIAIAVLLLNGLLFPIWWRVYDKVQELSTRVARIEGRLGVPEGR